MNEAQRIIDYAATLFDVVGAQDKLLILGLESTPERNLDDFGRVNGEFQLYGFEKYVRPKLEMLTDFIREQGFSAEVLGRLGYPLKGEFNLKELAISAGLGRRGKSTVVLHPQYANRLRFLAVKTDAPFEASAPVQPESENPVCQGCTVCLEACPLKILEPYRMLNTSVCLANSANMTEEKDRLIPCDLCLRLCPAG
ncbi:hypothetical protein ACFLYF_03990 [Chloroflexota bacterium]